MQSISLGTTLTAFDSILHISLPIPTVIPCVVNGQQGSANIAHKLPVACYRILSVSPKGSENIHYVAYNACMIKLNMLHNRTLLSKPAQSAIQSHIQMSLLWHQIIICQSPINQMSYTAVKLIYKMQKYNKTYNKTN